MKKRIYTYLYKKPTKQEKSRADWVSEGKRSHNLLELRAKTNDDNTKRKSS